MKRIVLAWMLLIGFSCTAYTQKSVDDTINLKFDYSLATSMGFDLTYKYEVTKTNPDGMVDAQGHIIGDTLVVWDKDIYVSMETVRGGRIEGTPQVDSVTMVIDSAHYNSVSDVREDFNNDIDSLLNKVISTRVINDKTVFIDRFDGVKSIRDERKLMSYLDIYSEFADEVFLSLPEIYHRDTVSTFYFEGLGEPGAERMKELSYMADDTVTLGNIYTPFFFEMKGSRRVKLSVSPRDTNLITITYWIDSLFFESPVEFPKMENSLIKGVISGSILYDKSEKWIVSMSEFASVSYIDENDNRSDLKKVNISIARTLTPHVKEWR